MNLQIKKQLSLYLKEKVLNHYLISFSRTECDVTLVKYLEKKPINYIDVGASSGEFAKSVEKYFGFKKAVLIEPIPRNILKLKNLFDYVSINQCALSDRAGIKKFNLYKFHYSSSLLKTLEVKLNKRKKNSKFLCRRISVQVETLDKIYKKYFSGDKIDLLKIDVQGNELNVLKGAQKCFSKIQNIFLEVSFRKLYLGSCLFFDIDNIMRKNGFVLISLQDGYRSKNKELLQADALYKRLNN